jgi:hypothetical protein
VGGVGFRVCGLGFRVRVHLVKDLSVWGDLDLRQRAKGRSRFGPQMQQHETAPRQRQHPVWTSETETRMWTSDSKKQDSTPFGPQARGSTQVCISSHNRPPRNPNPEPGTRNPEPGTPNPEPRNPGTPRQGPQELEQSALWRGLACPVAL